MSRCFGCLGLPGKSGLVYKKYSPNLGSPWPGIRSSESPYLVSPCTPASLKTNPYMISRAFLNLLVMIGILHDAMQTILPSS